MFFGPQALFGRSASGGALKPQDVFATTLAPGIFSSTKITTGIDMLTHGGLLWAKERTNDLRGHFLVDTARGVDKRLDSSKNDSELSTSVGYINSFDNDGFSARSDEDFLRGGENHVVWSFRRAPKFFDVVTYIGNGSNRSIAHSLGIAPGMIIFKRLNSTSNWPVYHRSLPDPTVQNLLLNSTNALADDAGIWDDTAPTSTHFTVTGSVTSPNLSGATYVAYLFAHDTAADGLVQCGSVTSTNDEPGNRVGLSLPWPIQLLMIKATSATGDWMMFDNVRSSPWGVSSQSTLALLKANSLSAETILSVSTQNQAGSQYIVFLPGDAGTTYSFLAIRAPI